MSACESRHLFSSDQCDLEADHNGPHMHFDSNGTKAWSMLSPVGPAEDGER